MSISPKVWTSSLHIRRVALRDKGLERTKSETEELLEIIDEIRRREESPG